MTGSIAGVIYLPISPLPLSAFCLRWTRYFYATSMPSIANNQADYLWPQLETTLQEHAAFRNTMVRDKQQAHGKAFKINEALDPAVRKGFVKCKLKATKKAGTVSNQKASAATAWLSANHAADFANASMAWTGQWLSWPLLRFFTTHLNTMQVGVVKSAIALSHPSASLQAPSS